MRITPAAMAVTRGDGTEALHALIDARHGVGPRKVEVTDNHGRLMAWLVIIGKTVIVGYGDEAQPVPVERAGGPGDGGIASDGVAARLTPGPPDAA